MVSTRFTTYDPRNCSGPEDKDLNPNTTIPTENATPPKSAKSRNPNYSVQIQMKVKSQIEFVPRDTEESELLDLPDFEGVLVAFSVEIVIMVREVAYFRGNCQTWK